MPWLISLVMTNILFRLALNAHSLEDSREVAIGDLVSIPFPLSAGLLLRRVVWRITACQEARRAETKTPLVS